MQAPCGGGERSDHSFGVRVLSLVPHLLLFILHAFTWMRQAEERERGERKDSTLGSCCIR